MATYQGDAPSVLQPAQVLAVVLLQAAEFYLQEPCSELFLQAEPEPVWASKVFVEQRVKYRQIGALHAAHSAADRAHRQRIGAREEQVLHQFYKDLIPADVLAKLQANPSLASKEGASQIAAGALDILRRQAEKERDEILADFTALCARTFGQWACKVLQGGNYTLSIDGVTNTVASAVPLSTTAQGVTLGDWASPTAPIPQDLALIIDDATDRMGRPPTHLIYGSLLRQAFAKNENIIKVIEGGSAAAFNFLVNPPAQIVSESAMRMERIEHWGTFKETPSSSAQRFWPIDRVTCYDASRGGLRVITRPTLAHQEQTAYQHPSTNQGFFARVWTDPETAGEWVGVGHNGAPVVIDPECAVTYDIGAK